MAQWQGHVLVTSKTWVQVPGLANCNIIFQRKFLCSAPIVVHHVPSSSRHTRVQSNQFKGQDSGSTVGASQYATQNLEKSTNFKAYWAKMLGLYLLNWDYTPLWFATSFNFLLIFILLLIIMLFILLL